MSASAHLLGLWVEIVLGHGHLSVLFVVCFVGSSLWNKLITCSEECYKIYVCVCVCVCVCACARVCVFFL